MDFSNPYIAIALVALVANVTSMFVGMTCPMDSYACRGECPARTKSTDVEFYVPGGYVFSLAWTVLYSLLAFTTVRAYYGWSETGSTTSALTLFTGVLIFMIAQHYVFMASPRCFGHKDLALYDILMMLVLAYIHLLGVYTNEGVFVATLAVPLVVWLTMALQMQYVRVPPRGED